MYSMGPEVFISYSRKDAIFARRLDIAFKIANRVIWVDWLNIPRGENFREEIEHGIEVSDTFLCVVTEDWLTSEMCQWELQYARKNSKRVIPLIRQRIDADTNKQVDSEWDKLAWGSQARDNWNYLRGHLKNTREERGEQFEKKR
jgi:hypothetical protein